MPAKTPDPRPTSKAEQKLDELAEAGREAKAAAAREHDEGLEKTRALWVWHAVNPPLRKLVIALLVAQTILFLAAIVVGLAPVAAQWLHLPPGLRWLPAAILALGWPALIWFRRHAIRRVARAERGWAAGLPWPVEGYLQWLAWEEGHRQYALIRFRDPFDRELVEDALSGAVNPATWHGDISFESRDPRALAVHIPSRLELSGGEHQRYAAHFGDAPAFRALVEALRVVDEASAVESIRFTDELD